MKHHLSVDIETRSSAPIAKAGAYKYAQSPDFEILLLAYQLDNLPVEIIDLANGEPVPAMLVNDLKDPNVIKHAYNAAFEWCCLNRAGYETPIDQWRCTMAHGLYCGYTAGLEATGKAAGLPEDKQKLATGRALIRYFCTPCKPTGANGGRTWNQPWHDPDKWEMFKEYCRQDVVTEHELLKRLNLFPMPEAEEHLWQMDVLMNAYGVRVDVELIKGALSIDGVITERLTSEAVALTGLQNPNSQQQLLKWLRDNGTEADNLRKDTVTELLESINPDNQHPEKVQRVLEIRRQLSKTSNKKYVAMTVQKGEGDRIRGLTQYYGGNRTGRYAGRLTQMQNLPRNYLKTLDCARTLVKAGNHEGVRILYGNVPDTLSQLIRTAFIPSEGRKFVVADFSAIEARVIAWLAKEQWVCDVFATHGRIYEAAAAQMFGIPVDKIVKGRPEYEYRAKGKVATLALGYQGGTAALIRMHALENGLTEEELPDIVRRWREANPRIRDLWHQVEQAAVAVMQTAQPQGVNGLIFSWEGDLIYGQSFFTVRLPSGRKLYYAKPFLEDAEDPQGRLKPALHYYGMNQQSKKWTIDRTYGGRLVENIVQAIARDCLAVTLERIAARGLQVVFHVHDEVIIDAPMDLTVEEICGLMAEPIPWAPGLALKGAGFENNYYMKD